jgi:hypothetical protein
MKFDSIAEVYDLYEPEYFRLKREGDNLPSKEAMARLKRLRR